MRDQRDSWVVERAGELRKERIDAEGLMWLELRKSRFRGFRFRRQHVIGRFIVDFYCAEKRVAVEIDGPTHDPDRDERRDALLEGAGVRVVRFTNDEVYRDMAGCLAGLADVLTGRPSYARRYGSSRLSRVADLDHPPS